jgi:hypothetical protein
MHIVTAPEQFGLDSENFDKRLIESLNFHIDLGLSQLREVGVGPRVACVLGT